MRVCACVLYSFSKEKKKLNLSSRLYSATNFSFHSASRTPIYSQAVAHIYTLTCTQCDFCAHIEREREREIIIIIIIRLAFSSSCLSLHHFNYRYTYIYIFVSIIIINADFLFLVDCVVLDKLVFMFLFLLFFST